MSCEDCSKSCCTEEPAPVRGKVIGVQFDFENKKYSMTLEGGCTYALSHKAAHLALEARKLNREVYVVVLPVGPYEVQFVPIVKIYATGKVDMISRVQGVRLLGESSTPLWRVSLEDTRVAAQAYVEQAVVEIYTEDSGPYQLRRKA